MESAIQERVQEWYVKRKASGENGEASAGAKDGDGMGLAAEEMTELILDGRQFRTVSEEAAKLLKQLKNLAKLTCNQTGLNSVAAFPPMPSVKTLELTDNHISGGLDALVKAFPNLKRLQLGGNHFKTFEDIDALKQLESLEQLGLDMSPVSTLAGYREKLFEMLPKLEVLDSTDKDGNEVEVADSDDEEEEDEDYDDEEADTTLKDFYEKDLDDEDDEDEEDFNPEGEDDEDEDFDEDGEEDEEGGAGAEGETVADEDDSEDVQISNKRKNESATAPASDAGESSSSSVKQPRLN